MGVLRASREGRIVLRAIDLIIFENHDPVPGNSGSSRTACPTEDNAQDFRDFAVKWEPGPSGNCDTCRRRLHNALA